MKVRISKEELREVIKEALLTERYIAKFDASIFADDMQSLNFAIKDLEHESPQTRRDAAFSAVDKVLGLVNDSHMVGIRVLATIMGGESEAIPNEFTIFLDKLEELVDSTNVRMDRIRRPLDW